MCERLGGEVLIVVEGRRSVPADNTPQKHYNKRANIWTPLCGQICVQGSGPKRGLVGVWGSSVEGLPLPLLNHLYLFHCVLVSSSVAVVAIYEMALKLFSVSAFALCLPLTLSLCLSTSVSVAFAVSRFSYCGCFSFHFVCAKATDALALAQCSYLSNWSSAKMLHTPLPTPLYPLSLSRPFAIVLTSGPHFTCLAHWRFCCPRLHSPLSTPLLPSRLFIARGSN